MKGARKLRAVRFTDLVSGDARGIRVKPAAHFGSGFAELHLSTCSQ
jgi:hypothetical protein